MSKKLISFGLVLAVFLAALSVFSFATENNSVYTVTVDGKAFQSNTSNSGNGWSYADGVLTLNKYNGSTVKSTGDLNVIIINSANISGSSSGSYSASSCGIVATGALTLTVYGDVSIKGADNGSAKGGEAVVADSVFIKSYDGTSVDLYGGRGAVALKANDITLKVRDANICGGSDASAIYFAKSLSFNGSSNADILAGSKNKSAITYNAKADYYFSDDEQTVEFEDKNSVVIVSAKNSFIYGDCNSDGKVNTKDIVLLAQHLANYDVSINEFAADCRYDDSVDIKDAVLLVQYLAMWNVYLG